MMQINDIPKCETCEWCELEILKLDGTEDKRYKNRKYCRLHKRSTSKEGYCHWHLNFEDMRGDSNDSINR